MTRLEQLLFLNNILLSEMPHYREDTYRNVLGKKFCCSR